MGFFLDSSSSLNKENSDDFNKILFSPQRIIFSLIKSLPHFFCLSYVTVCLTCALVRACMYKYKYCRMKPEEKTMSLIYEYYTASASATSNRGLPFNLIYTRKIQDSNKMAHFSHARLSFEERYISNLFKQQQQQQHKIEEKKSFLIFKLFNKNDLKFRFSTRVISTYTVCFTVLFYFTCLLSFYGSIFVDMLYLPSCYAYTLIASSILTSIVCGIQLMLSLNSLKIHLTYLYKGHCSLESEKKKVIYFFYF